MIAVALGLISLVVMIATGVAASSTGGDHLVFLGVGVQTTTAQVFITGAIFGWVFVIALWLLRVGMHRSGERCAELAARRSRRAGEWLGFRESETEDDGWGGWDEWSGSERRPSRSGRRARGGQPAGGRPRSIRSRTTGRRDAESFLAESVLADNDFPGGFQPDGDPDRPGAARHGGGAPWRPDGRLDGANRPPTGAADQPGPLGGGHPPGPVAGRLGGRGVDGGAQYRQIGSGPGPVPGEDRGADGEYRPGEGRQ